MFFLILTLLFQIQPMPVHSGTPIFDRLRPEKPVPMPTVKKVANPPKMGEKRLFWLQNMTVMPPVQFQASLTCRGLGNHCHVMIDDSVWNAGLVDSADVARIIERFDHSSPRDSLHGVWYYNTTVLGQPPDVIDHDSLIYLLYYNIGTFHGYTFDGFWQFFDEYYDTTSMRLWGYHSNEIECVYLDCYPNNPAKDYRMAISAHEFGHMIHWNYNPAESLWVNEGCSELAMWLYGSPDPITGFTNCPDNDLTRWTGAWDDYIKTYLWFLFLYEQYGGRIGTDLIHNIVASPLVSIAGIDSGFAATGLPQRFEGVLDQWVLANRINDTGVLSGAYGYYGDTVPSFAVAGYHTSYPVSRTGNLDRWAGEYLLFQHGTNLELEFDGADTADFRLYLVARDTIRHRVLLDTIPLDSLQRGSTTVRGFDTAYQSVYLVPVNHTVFGHVGYEYHADAVGLEECPPDMVPPTRFSTLMRAGTVLTLPKHSKILSVDGRVISEPETSTGKLRAGVYFVITDKPSRKHRLLIVR
ncbi:hypothetical protein CH330_02445 [candidate division WOR-3 bacterium JGI_Cruoil_03_51_56]|uniref:Peptidase M6-like domain-containing protein n=1 Tax=candidate division WOR-3 bacterium JGI_Cruoil_03_51_56 TaxID=1973747 RepID=A0A235BWS5_UNCW3|nr:MAG: hypothetical protein CH330_02445 [candidate division WOR-3 bacterium JGI_Cruoil_03_51_56]